MSHTGPSPIAVSTIAVSTGRPLGTIDRKLFGGFVEHLGHCVYGGLYDEGSSLADKHGFRQDVLGLLRDLRLGVLRWPGGNFVSNYHWQDGIGPKDARPRRPELAWGGEEPNRFGTDEFMAYCAELGPEPDSVAPYVCLNMGTGTLAEALAWVEYCNSARNTYWADRRRENGRDEPYRVRYWALGNEMYGDWQVGQLSAEEYVREATRWARAIRMLDPEAQLIGCGETGWTEWDRVVIDGLAGLVDYHSVHLYTGSDDYWTNVLTPHQAERAISAAGALLDRAAYLRGLPRTAAIAYDEWNVWYRTMTVDLAERYTHADALAVATYLNIFVRNCARVRMANLAQMVNAIAPIVATPSSAVAQPIYYPFLLHARAALDLAVDAHVDGALVPPEASRFRPDASRWPHRIADLGPFTLVDAAASVSADRRRIAVTLVNRGLEAEPARLVLRDAAFDGAAAITTLTAGSADDLEAGDARPMPDVAAAHLAHDSERAHGALLALTLPPQSFCVIEARVAAS